MRNIDPVIIEKLASEQFKAAFLLKILFAEDTVYFTTWDYSLLWDGKSYLPKGMDLGVQKFGSSSMSDSVSIKIDDVDRSLYALFANGEIKFPPSIVSIAVIDDNGAILAVSDTFVGTVSEWTYSPGEINYKISSKFIQWANITTSTFSGSCRWRVFKGSECKHSGTEITCNRTYDHCLSLSNTNNFGGFRWLQGVETKIKAP